MDALHGQEISASLSFLNANTGGPSRNDEDLVVASAEVIGVKGSCDRVAGGAITPTLQTLVLLLGRV